MDTIPPLQSEKRSIDLVKRYLMQRISAFAASVTPEEYDGPKQKGVIPSELHKRFLEHVCKEGLADPDT